MIKANGHRGADGRVEDAEYVFVAYGLPGRSTLGAVLRLRAAGRKVGLIRPLTAWPFPEKAFAKAGPSLKAFITVEANATGQLVEDVALCAKKIGRGNVPVYALTYRFGIPPLKRVVEELDKVASGEIKEVFCYGSRAQGATQYQ